MASLRFQACRRACKCGITMFQFILSSLSFHYAKSNSLSQLMEAGGNCPLCLWLKSTPPPTATPVPLDPSAQGSHDSLDI